MGTQIPPSLGVEDDDGDEIPSLRPRGLDIGPHELACLEFGVWGPKRSTGKVTAMVGRK